MSILDETMRRCPELGEWLQDVREQPLEFPGDEPNDHSSLNHVHLWALEWWADRVDFIDLPYRVSFARSILSRWRERLKGTSQWERQGFRMYLYEDMAPTVSVVAETPGGFPYPGEPTFVASVEDVMRLYVDRPWRSLFDNGPEPPSRERILEVIEGNAGSIGKPSAERLGLKTGMLRILIENTGLERQVNAIRKRHGRSPARFRPFEEPPDKYRVFEERLPPRYR